MIHLPLKNVVAHFKGVKKYDKNNNFASCTNVPYTQGRNGKSIMKHGAIVQHFSKNGEIIRKKAYFFWR